MTVTAPSVKVFRFESEDFGKLEAVSRVVCKHLHVAVSNSVCCSEETLFITPFKGTSLLGLAILVILICFVVLTADQGGGWRHESCFSV